MDDPFDRDRSVRHGVPEEVAPGVRRIVAPNPSAMTFTGTCSYLVGTGQVALVDPGPEDERHAAAILGALGPSDRIAAIMVTHTHSDHSAGAAEIHRATGAPVIAFGPHGAGMSEAMRQLATRIGLGGGEGADRDFVPDYRLGDGEQVAGPDWRLSAVHTPGHLSNHLCFALEDTGILFTGDMAMGWASSLVSPPEGDMAAYMASLERLTTRGDAMFLPGHGKPVADPAALLAYLRAHRTQRAEQILAALEAGPHTTAALTREIYTDVDPMLVPAAERNVLATLIWQMEQGRVAPEGEVSAAATFHLV